MTAKHQARGFHDVPVCVVAEEQLRCRERQLRVIADALPVLVAYVDSDLRYQFVNRAYEDWFGCSRSDVEGKRLREVLGEAVFETLRPGVEEGLAGRKVTLDALIPRRGNEERHILASYLPHVGEDGTVEGCVCLFNDITDGRQAEDTERLGVAAEHARMVGETEDAVRKRDEFLSVASHELKTPLTSLQLLIDGLIRIVGREPLAPAFQEKLLTKLGKIGKQSQRLARLVEELLDVSRISAGRLRLELQDVDLATVVGEVIVRLAGHAIRAGCVIDLTRSGVTAGRWDRSRLDQIVTSLLSNSLKYGAGSPIEIAIGGEGDQVRLSVADRGVGIPTEDQARIFERFERAVPIRNYGGLGLGLWIIRQIVEAHGGTVGVVSSEGRGSTFTVELPRIAPEPAAAISLTAATSPG